MAGFVIPQDVMDKCHAAFNKVDTEGTGVIEVEDLRECFRAMGFQNVSKDEVDVVLEASGVWGAQQATKLDFDDFVGLTLEYRKLNKVQDHREQETKTAFKTLGGDEDGAGSIRAESLRDFVKQFELGIDIDALLTEVDEDGNGVLEWDEFSKLLTEKPDATMLAGGFQLRGSGTQDNSWGGPKRKGNSEKKPKANREKKPSVAEDDDEDDDTKIRRTRKRFQFMEDLHKQYMNQKRWPPGRSDSSGKRGAAKGSEQALRRSSSQDEKSQPLASAASSSYYRSSSMANSSQAMATAKTAKSKRSSIAGT